MCSFNRLHTQVDRPSFGVGANSGVAGVREGARLSTTETGDIVFVSAERLVFCRFEFVGAECMSNVLC